MFFFVIMVSYGKFTVIFVDSIYIKRAITQMYFFTPHFDFKEKVLINTTHTSEVVELIMKRIKYRCFEI